MSCNVLIVDDSSVARKTVGRVLQLSRFPHDRPLEAANGVEAIAVLESTPVDLVITDINMPEMNGEELVNWIENQPALGNLPVLVLSTECSLARMNRMNRIGIRGFLSKPFTPEALRNEVDRILLSRDVKNRFEDLLATVIEEALQTMCFMALVEPPESVRQVPAECIHAKVDFSAELPGVLYLSVERALAWEMAENILGAEESRVAERQVEETVCELTNVICGSLLGRLERNNDYGLQPPTLLAGRTAEICEAVRLRCESGALFAAVALGV